MEPSPSQAEWSALHRELISRVTERGLALPGPAHYWWRASFVSALFTGGFLTLLLEPSPVGRTFALAAAAFAAFQGGLLSHDLTHGNVTSREWMTRLLGQFFMTLLTGQTYGHWEWKHTRHHSHTQEALDDPDMTVGLFALSKVDAQRKRGWQRWTTRFQHVLLWPLITLQVFSIRGNTVRFLLFNPSRTVWDAMGFAAHLVLWLVAPAVVLDPWTALANYFFYTWMMGPYAAAAFLWNHVGSRVVEPGERLPYFLQRMEGSRNLANWAPFNFLFGGLNFHVEHHLAPHVPSARLPLMREELTALLAREGIPYREWGFAEAMLDVYRHLREVASEVEPTAVSPREALSPRTAGMRSRPSTPPPAEC